MSIKYNGGVLPTVGADGTTLVANSSASTGVSWAGPIVTAGKNALINGGMDIWQRGTSSTSNLAYIADRWFQYTSAGTTTFSRESTIVPTGSQYSMKIAQASASAVITVNQAIETFNAIQFAGQTVNVSMMCYASASTGMQIQVQYSTSVDNGTLGTWTAITASSGGAATVTNAWQKMTGTYAIPSTAKSIYISLFIPTLTATTNAYFGQAQLELGSVPTAFSRAGGTLSGELTACQRYYRRFTAGGAAPYWRIAIGQNLNTTQSQFVFPLGSSMRAVPSFNASGSFTLRQGDTSLGTNAPTLQGDGSTQDFVGLVVGMSGGTTGYGCYLRSENNTSTYLEFSAEL